MDTPVNSQQVQIYLEDGFAPSRPSIDVGFRVQFGIRYAYATIGSQTNSTYTKVEVIVPTDGAEHTLEAVVTGPTLSLYMDGVLIGKETGISAYVSSFDYVQAGEVAVNSGTIMAMSSIEVNDCPQSQRTPIAACTQGPTWTQTTIPQNVRGYAVLFGGGQLVALGSASGGGTTMMYSSNYGATWNTSASVIGALDGSQPHRKIAYGFNTFVVLYNTTQIFTSIDGGVTWQLTTRASTNFSGLTFASSFQRFIASVSGTNTCFTSTNGTTWTSRTMPSTQSWDACGYGSNGTSIITSVAGVTARSVNGGTSWTTSGSLPHAAGTTSIAYGNGVWVATIVGAETRVVYSIDDGANWQYATVHGTPITWTCVKFKQGLFVLMSSDGTVNYKSTNGTTWTTTFSTVGQSNCTFIDWDSDDIGHYAALGNGSTFNNVINIGQCGG